MTGPKLILDMVSPEAKKQPSKCDKGPRCAVGTLCQSAIRVLIGHDSLRQINEAEPISNVLYVVVAQC
jgi:hypothetical protein